MNSFSPWTVSLWDALGWTMLHFLWAGALVALVARVVLWVLRRRSPHVRYTVALVVFLLLASTPAALFAWRMAYREPVAEITIEVSRHASEPLADETTSFPELSRANNRLDKTANTKQARTTEPLRHATSVAASAARKVSDGSENFRLWTGNEFQRILDQGYSFALRLLPWLWVCGFPLACAWILLGVTGTERLRRTCRPLEHDEWLSLCRRVKQRLRIRIPVRFAFSDRLAVPLLIGIVRPLVLLPASALAGYSPEQVEMILLHELAHVRRWDNLVNLLQRMVEAVLFFHPSVWWLSRRVRLEREHCCDAVVLVHTGAPQRYAEFLAHLALPEIVPQRALGVSAGEQLVARIRHILNQENESMKVSRSSVIASSVCFVTLIAVAITWVHLQAAAAPVEIERTRRILRIGGETHISLAPPQPRAARDVPSVRLVAQATTPTAAESPQPGAAAAPADDAKVKAREPAFGADKNRVSPPSRDVYATTPAEREKAQLKFAGRAFGQWETVLMTELDPKMRVEALDALGRFGSFGYQKEASDAIARFLSKGRLISSDPGDRNVEVAAQVALGRIGSTAIPTMLHLLKDKSPEVRRLAIEIVSTLPNDGAEPKPSIPEALTEATSDPDQHVRLAALQAMAQLLGARRKLDRGPLILAATKRLQDDSPEVRREAAVLLGNLGPSAAGVVPALLAALKDPRNEKAEVLDYAIPRTVIEALRQCHTPPGVLVPALIELLSRAPADFRTLVVVTQAFEKLGPQAAPAIPALIAALKRADHTDFQGVGEPGSQLQHQAVQMLAEALKQIGPTKESPAARTVLLEKLSKLTNALQSSDAANFPTLSQTIGSIQLAVEALDPHPQRVDPPAGSERDPATN